MEIQKNNLYFRNYNINIYNININFSNIKSFHSNHIEGNERFSLGKLKSKNIEYVIKKLRTLKNPYKYDNLLISLNEVMASLIYNRVFKLYVPEIILINNNELYMVGSKLDKNLKPFKINKSHPDIIKGFIVDCIMANWDVIIKGNIFYTKKNIENISSQKKRIIRLDVGGSMYFRAMGDIKYLFLEKIPPNEHNTLKEFNQYFKKYITKKALSISIGYIKSIYNLQKFTELNKIRKEILYKMKKYFKNYEDYENIMNLISNLVNTNIKQIKYRWKWYINNNI
jgi:hypothetical protein